MTIEEIKEKLKVFDKFEFHEIGHYYTYDNQRIGISTTGLIGTYENEFDADKMSSIVANKRGVLQEEILEEWRVENKFSTIKGTHVHIASQEVWKDVDYDIDYTQIDDDVDKERLKVAFDKSKKLGVKFYNDNKDTLELIKDELLIASTEFDIAGSIDGLFYNKLTGGLVLADFKTNKEIKYKGYRGAKMKVPLQHLDDCNFVHYEIQTSIYRYLLEKYTGLKVDEMFLIYINENADDYEIIEVKYLKKEVEKILEMRKERIMGKCIPILFLGLSGAGKTACLRNMKDEDYSLINPLKKSLPFKSKKTGLESDNYELIKKFMAETPKNVIWNDDSGYLITNQFMRNHSKGGGGNAVFGVYNELADNYWNLIEFEKNIDGDKLIFNVMHEEELENGTIIPKTIGKLLDEKVNIQGMYTIVIRAVYKDGKHLIQVSTNGNDCVKTPIGMFDEQYYDNDLTIIINKIIEYYELNWKLTDKEENKKDEEK